MIEKKKPYYFSHLITTPDLFCNFDVKKLKGKGNIKRIYRCRDKKHLAENIFLRYLYMLMLYMIEQGDKTFIFPHKRFMSLHFRVVPQQRIKDNLKVGKLTDIDMLQSNFKSYEMVVSYYYKGLIIHQYVKLSANFLQLLHKKISEGFIYA